MVKHEYNAPLGPVEVVAVEEWERGNAKGRNVKFRTTPNGAVMRLPIAGFVNGDGPVAGTTCILAVECYPWHSAKLNRDGEPFSVVDTKFRVVGVVELVDELASVA